MTQNAKSLAERPQGSLPSNTEFNSLELLKAITLRSSKELVSSHEKSAKKIDLDEKGCEHVEDEQSNLTKGREVETPRVPENQLRLSYSAKVKNDQQDE